MRRVLCQSASNPPVSSLGGASCPLIHNAAKIRYYNRSSFAGPSPLRLHLSSWLRLDWTSAGYHTMRRGSSDRLAGRSQHLDWTVSCDKGAHERARRVNSCCRMNRGDYLQSLGMEKYQDAYIIFTDTERSNRTYDERQASLSGTASRLPTARVCVRRCSGAATDSVSTGISLPCACHTKPAENHGRVSVVVRRPPSSTAKTPRSLRSAAVRSRQS